MEQTKQAVSKSIKTAHKSDPTAGGASAGLDSQVLTSSKSNNNLSVHPLSTCASCIKIPPKKRTAPRSTERPHKKRKIEDEEYQGKVQQSQEEKDLAVMQSLGEKKAAAVKALQWKHKQEMDKLHQAHDEELLRLRAKYCNDYDISDSELALCYVCFQPESMKCGYCNNVAGETRYLCSECAPHSVKFSMGGDPQVWCHDCNVGEEFIY